MFEGFSLFDLAAWYVVFLGSTTLHEAAHAFAALKLGDDTAYRAGQVSIDPMPHIRREPFGMVLVPIIFYVLAGYIVGWASAPYDPDWARRYPRRAAVMAMAGPLSNLLLMLVAAGLIIIGLKAGLWGLAQYPRGDHVVIAFQEGWPRLCAVMLSIVFSLNLLLFCFNLIPLPPLDGSSIPLFFLSEEGAARYSEFLRHPALALIGMVVGFKVFGALFGPVQHFVVQLFFT